MFSALNYNYSWKLYAARRIRIENEDVLTWDAYHAFDELINALELFGPAHEHFKILYFRWALIDLSRTILYASIPALLTAVAGIIYLEPALFPGTVFGVRTLSIGPFILRKTDRSRDLDWGETETKTEKTVASTTRVSKSGCRLFARLSGRSSSSHKSYHGLKLECREVARYRCEREVRSALAVATFLPRQHRARN